MSRESYKLGVALSGGGAKGFAHCGALLALEEFGLKPDIISGTSAGAIAGAAYCAGRDPFEIVEGFMGREFSHFASLTLPRSGFFDHAPLLNLIREWTAGKSFEQLDIPLLVEACNIDRGESTTFKSGDLAQCVLASASVPVVFKPVMINGEWYVDGGVFKNLPVSPIRELCERVIAIDVGIMKPESGKTNIINIATNSFFYMLTSNSMSDISLCDIYIHIEGVGKYAPFDLEHINDIFRVGYISTVQQLERRYGFKRIEASRLRELVIPASRRPKPRSSTALEHEGVRREAKDMKRESEQRGSAKNKEDNVTPI